MPGGLAPGRSAPPGMVPASALPPVDPFAAAAPTAGPREVRLVIDDKAVSDAEVGRKSGFKFIIAAVAAAIVGVAVGGFIGSTARERQIYDIVLADAKDVYKSVNDASGTVEKAQKLLDQVAKSAAPGAGKGTEIDFKSLEELRKLNKPFPADVFSRKYYRAFGPATVDALFTYYNNTNVLWAKIGVITARSLAPANREGLERAAKAAADLSSTEYGCVPFKADEKFGCGMVTVQREGDKVKAVTKGGAYDKTEFAGQDLGAKTSDYVIVIDKARSGDILSAPTSPFQTFARDLVEAKGLADQTTEIQGRLIQQLGELAKLQSLN
jgi:hypothetical protein